MQKVLFIIIVILLVAVTMGVETESFAKGFENFSTLDQAKRSSGERIDKIEIYVISRKIKIFQAGKSDSPMEEFVAGTATPRNAKSIPYGIIGSAYKIVLNPTYHPTEDHLKKEQAKRRKIVREIKPNDPNNPLGKMKIYFTFPKIDPGLSFGAHGTNKPSSIGKRSSEGCVRLKDGDIEKIVSILLEQNGLDSETIFKQAAENQGMSYQYILKKRPRIVFLNK